MQELNSTDQSVGGSLVPRVIQSSRCLNDKQIVTVMDIIINLMPGCCDLTKFFMFINKLL